MIYHLKRNTTLKGFTIVELLIVIVIIAILAAITIVAFNGIQQRATASTIKSELSQNAKTLAAYNVLNEQYPPDAATGGLKSGGSITYIVTPDFKAYCLQIVENGQVYKVSSDNSAPEEGICSSVTPSFTAVTSTSFSLTWTAATDASSYNAQCATNAGYTTGVQNRSVTTTSASFTGLTAGTTYYCRVQVIIGGSTGDWSSTVTGSTSAPAVPTGLTASSITATSYTISWTAVPGAVGYTAQCSTNTSYSSFVLNNSSLTGTSVSVTGLSGATTYYCRVLARGTSSNSAYTANLTTTTATPATPAGLAAASVVTTSFTLNWTASSGAIGYTWQCATDAGFTTSVISGSPTPATASVTGLTGSTTYYCRVLARGTNTSSAYSAAITVTTAP